MRRVVLVNGVPASGKTTVARAVSASLGVPLLTLDTIKEQLFDELGSDGDREFGRALGRASLRAIWALIADFPPDALVVVDAWFRLPPHDAVLGGLRAAGCDRWVELWCSAPADLLAQRYAGRERHAGHPSAEAYVAELMDLARTAKPMAIGPCLKLDTSDVGSLDIGPVVSWIRANLGTECR